METVMYTSWTLHIATKGPRTRNSVVGQLDKIFELNSFSSYRQDPIPNLFW